MGPRCAKWSNKTDPECPFQSISHSVHMPTALLKQAVPVAPKQTPVRLAHTLNVLIEGQWKSEMTRNSNSHHLALYPQSSMVLDSQKKKRPFLIAGFLPQPSGGDARGPTHHFSTAVASTSRTTLLVTNSCNTEDNEGPQHPQTGWGRVTWNAD